MNISLIYLSYIPFGKDYLESFLNSYISKHAGIEHQLVIVFNGHKDENEIQPFLSILVQSNVSYEYIVCPEKYDIDSYFYSAKSLFSEYIIFLNTYSIILHSNWLLSLYQNIIRQGIGCVGATGSWGDFAHKDQYLKLKNEFFKFNMNSIKKLIFFRYNFYPHVKPHIRTNTFLIRRELFLKLDFNSVKPLLLNYFYNISATKLKSLCFEHGNNSLTNQINRLGLKVLVVDKYGIGYEINEWDEARTFWISQQENLLVSDNQTRNYDLGDETTKRQYQYAAWGKRI